jgi:tryptophan synthase alpha chain
VPFVYYVSVTGVTGTGALDAAGAGTRAAKLRRELGLPVVVGFGIDSREKARAAAAGTDGVVVGSALVRAIEEGKSPQQRRAAVERLIGNLRAGLDDIAQ